MESDCGWLTENLWMWPWSSLRMITPPVWSMWGSYEIYLGRGSNSRPISRAVTESELAQSRPRYLQMKFPFTVPQLRGPSFTVNGKHLTPFCLSTLLNDKVSGLYYMASVMNERMDGWTWCRYSFYCGLFWGARRYWGCSNARAAAAFWHINKRSRRGNQPMMSHMQPVRSSHQLHNPAPKHAL